MDITAELTEKGGFQAPQLVQYKTPYRTTNKSNILTLMSSCSFFKMSKCILRSYILMNSLMGDPLQVICSLSAPSLARLRISKLKPLSTSRQTTS